MKQPNFRFCFIPKLYACKYVCKLMLYILYNVKYQRDDIKKHVVVVNRKVEIVIFHFTIMTIIVFFSFCNFIVWE